MNSPEARMDGTIAPTDGVASLAANAPFRDGVLAGKSTVDRESAGALDEDGECEKVVFKAFTVLIAKPICEKAKVPMDHDHGHKHVASNAESGFSIEQAEATEKFGADGQESEWRGNVHALGEETHGAGEPIAAEPAQGFLRAIGKEDHPKDEANDRQS